MRADAWIAWVRPGFAWPSPWREVRNPSRVLSSVVLLCAALTSGLGCSRREREHEGEAPAGKRQVRCAPVTTVEVTDAIELRGTVSPLPDRDAQIAPQVA